VLKSNWNSTSQELKYANQTMHEIYLNASTNTTAKLNTNLGYFLMQLVIYDESPNFP
jgi:hypothetical protein